MKRFLSTLVVSALAVVAIGGLNGLAAQAAWRNTANMVTKNYPVSAGFTDISITEYYADVKLRTSRDGSISVTTRDAEDVTHTVQVVNGTLTISRPEPTMGERWFHDDDDDPTVTLYLPAGNYGSLTVNTTSGDVETAGQLNFSAANLTTVSGDVDLAGSVTGAVNCTTTSGDIELKGPTLGAVQTNTTSGDTEITGAVIQSLKAESVSGDLESVDAASLTLSTTSGEVEGSLLSGKNFSVSSTSGRVNVPASTAGAGACTVSTTSGSIRLTVRP